MKIDTGGILQTRNRADSGAGLKHAPQKNAAGRTASMSQTLSTMQYISNARTLLDAMAISQMAQNIMSRATEITSRLKEIARNAMASGRINSQELQDAISETKISFDKLRETFTAPEVSNNSADLINSLKGNNINIELPRFEKEVELLADLQDELTPGRIPGSKEIEKINTILDNLQKKSGAIESAYQKIETVFAVKNTDNIPAGLIIDTGKSITGKPDQALTAQGNINSETAGTLIKSGNI